VVRYATPHGGRTTLDVYDSSGRHVRNLLDQEVQAGLRFLSWNQSASDGRKLPAGVYMIRLRSVQGTKAVRMVVLR
jgi:flagellar hook assembly protein FlgD